MHEFCFASFLSKSFFKTTSILLLKNSASIAWSGIFHSFLALCPSPDLCLATVCHLIWSLSAKLTLNFLLSVHCIETLVLYTTQISSVLGKSLLVMFVKNPHSENQNQNQKNKIPPLFLSPIKSVTCIVATFHY